MLLSALPRGALLALFAITFCSLAAAGDLSAISIGVSPPRLEVEISGDSTNESLRVLNMGTEPVAIDVTVHGWVLDAANKLQLVEPDEQSLDQWMIVNPLSFTLEPGDSQTVRLSIRPKVRPEPGEHRAIVYFRQTPPPTEGSSMRVLGRVGVAVYGYVGEVERLGELNGVRIDTAGSLPRASFDISSSGSGYVRLVGQYAVWPADRYPGDAIDADETSRGRSLETGMLPNLPVLPGTRRQLALRLNTELPAGKYVLDVDGDLSGVAIRVGVPFVVGAADVAQDIGE